MVTKTLARVGQSPAGFLLLGAVVGLVAFGTYVGGNRLASAARRASTVAARPVAARPAPRPLSSRRQHVLTPEQEFGPAPTAAGFAEVLVSTSNAFAQDQGAAARLTHAHCVQASRGHYMCAYLVKRPGRPSECHLIQAHWAEERASSFTVVLSGRARRCGSVREAVRSLD
jgi:hypothetical protein